MKLLFKLQTIFLALLVSYLPINTASGQCNSNDPSAPVGIIPTLVEGNPGLCSGGTRINSPTSGTHNLDGFGNTVTVTITSGPCGEVFSWTVSGNIVIDQVIAKGGPNANVYNYTGKNPRPSSDGDLHSPVNESGGYADLSHLDFCFHYRLDVSKTAETFFTRDYDWSIDKECRGPGTLTLTEGQVYNYPFRWTASISGYTDSDWSVEGTITVENNTPMPPRSPVFPTC